MNLKRNQPQPPFCLGTFTWARSCLPLFAGPRPEPAAALPPMLYRFLALTEMMSWLSLSSPVSAEKPRYETAGMAMLVSGAFRVKQLVQVSSDLYCKSRVRDLSWKYVKRALVGIEAPRRPRACHQFVSANTINLDNIRASSQNSQPLRWPFRHEPGRKTSSHRPSWP